MNYQTVQYTLRDDAVAIITFNRPAALNALTIQMATEWREAFSEALAQHARAIVLTGAGRAFCAGGDVREMQRIAAQEGRTEAFFAAPLRTLHDCVLQIRRIPLPVIAAVNGVAAGAGCNVALACDLVLAAESASFNEAFIKIGLSPDCGGTFILPRLVGMKRAAELLMIGDTISASRAAEIGMINAVVPDGELMTSALNLAARLAQAPTDSIARIKKLLDESATNDYAAQLEREHAAQLKSGQSKDFKEGVAAFLEKRLPKFVGE
jgi:2-(1,2-epoxy-1,2-dihydrophenyl)acetyl-CoA isomerase